MPGERFVYLVNDDAAMQGSLDELLCKAQLRVIWYHTAATFADAVPDLEAGCVLLDLDLEGMDGPRMLAELRWRDADLAVVVMTAHGDVATAVRSMKAGAVDFLEKPFSDADLLDAIQAAMRPQNSAARDREASDAARRMAQLSARERQVLEALTLGRPNKRIATDLGLSVRTIEVHRARMMRRLGVRQFAEAVRIAVLATKSPSARADRA